MKSSTVFRTLRYLFCLIAIFAGLYGVIVAFFCSLLCSSTYLDESNVVSPIVIAVLFYLCPFIGISGAIMVWLGKRAGTGLMIMAGVGMAYTYGIGNIPSVIYSATPLIGAGVILFCLLDAEMRVVRKKGEFPDKKI